MIESCGFVTPFGIVVSYNSSRMSTIIAMAPGLLGDTYGGNKFFCSLVSSTFGDGGGTGSNLLALSNFATGPDEVGRSAVNGVMVTKTWALTSCTGN